MPGLLGILARLEAVEAISDQGQDSQSSESTTASSGSRDGQLGVTRALWSQRSPTLLAYVRLHRYLPNANERLAEVNVVTAKVNDQYIYNIMQ